MHKMPLNASRNSGCSGTHSNTLSLWLLNVASTGLRGRPPKTNDVSNKTNVTQKTKKPLSAAKAKKAKLKKLKSLKKDKKREKEKKVSKKNLHPNSKLTQRPEIEVVSKDPMFEVK